MELKVGDIVVADYNLLFGRDEVGIILDIDGDNIQVLLPFYRSIVKNDDRKWWFRRFSLTKL